jgi:hypothetical protein
MPKRVNNTWPMVENLTCTLNANLEENLQTNSNKIQHEGYCLKTSMCDWKKTCKPIQIKSNMKAIV